jgi:hypothetical protein
VLSRLALTIALVVVPLGRSVDGRQIVAERLGNPHGARVLVVGCIHGNECAGLAVVRELERRPPSSIDLWLVPDLNPDGHAAGTRGNAHGVDLNRNFPAMWKPIGRRGDPQWSGPRPLSAAHPAGGHDLVPPAAGRRARVGTFDPGRAPFRAPRRGAVPRTRVAERDGAELAEPSLRAGRVVRRRAAAGAADARRRRALRLRRLARSRLSRCCR